MKKTLQDEESLNLSLKPPFQPLPPLEKPLQSSLPPASSFLALPSLPNSVSPTMSLFPNPYPLSPIPSASINNVVDPSSTSTSSTSTTSTDNVGNLSPLTPALLHPNPGVAGPSTLTPIMIYPNPNVGDSSPLTPAIVHPDPFSSKNPQPHYEQQGRRRQRDPTQGKSEIVPAPYPWATNRRATVYSLEHLLRNGIVSISGSVECKKCNVAHHIEFDLETKFFEVAGFIRKNRGNMHDRAPKEWLNPLLPDCRFCEKANCVKPIIEKKKKQINWLFLFLGQMLGCCTLNQLKYFCKHTRNHRTGAKDRVLYLTYITLAEQVNRRITEGLN